MLYFYPAAFTSGCTIEAHEFAEAMGKFQALDATVIGVSNDDCNAQQILDQRMPSKFPVAAHGDQRIMKAYNAVMMGFLSYANRTSYIIAPDGHIIHVYTGLDPSNHVENTLAAVRSWKSEQK